MEQEGASVPQGPTEEQIQTYEKELAEQGGLNNFFGELPGGYRRERFKEVPEMLNTPQTGRRGETRTEFWGHVDEAIKEAGIDEQQIKDLEDGIRQGGREGKTREELMAELNDLVKPAYYRLRGRYPKKDLTA